MDSSSTSPSPTSKQGDSREIPVQNDIWFVKETTCYQDYLEDVAKETERIRSGYYLDIGESLDTCKRYCDYLKNPFYKVHMGAVQYLHQWKKQAHKHPVDSEDESSSEHSTSFIGSSSASSVHFESSPGLLNKAMGRSIINRQSCGGRRKRLDSDEMSGIGLLSPSSSANTPINDLEHSLPEHMDNVLNELSRMEPDELSRLINTATPVSESAALGCTSSRLLCYETLGSSSPDVDRAESPASSTESQQCRLNRRYVSEFNASDSSETSTDAEEDVYEYRDCQTPSTYQFPCHY